MRFVDNLHNMLHNDADRWDDLGGIVGFLPHGRAFQIHHEERFANEVLPVCFGHDDLQWFLQQLVDHGFRRVRSGHRDEGAYYHHYFQRYRPELLPRITTESSSITPEIDNPNVFYDESYVWTEEKEEDDNNADAATIPDPVVMDSGYHDRTIPTVGMESLPSRSASPFPEGAHSLRSLVQQLVNSNHPEQAFAFGGGPMMMAPHPQLPREAAAAFDAEADDGLLVPIPLGDVRQAIAEVEDELFLDLPDAAVDNDS